MNKTRFWETQFNWSIRCIKLFILIVCIPLLSIGSNKIDDTTCLYYKLKNNKYYKGNSTVFCKNYNLNLILYHEIERFTPSPFEIERAEKILDSCLPNYDFLMFPKKKRRKIYRKYVGLTARNNEKIIFIELIDYSNKLLVNRLLGKEWRYDINFVMSDKYYKISSHIKINLSKSELINNNN